MKAPVQRFLSALCALSFLFAALFPTAALAAGADDLAVFNTLTREDAAQMQEADSAVAALTDSGDFAALSRAERFAAAQAQLQQLAEQGLVSVRSIYIDEANGMVNFSYSCGVQGGILVDDPEEENAAVTLSQMPSVDLQEMSNAPRGNLGSAMIYYAFDNTVNSSRYPYYSYMKGFWTAMGLNTRIDTMVTVADLRRMDRYDLCILSAHGAYYTYARGLFRKLRTEPVILLTEESSMTRDLFYGFDLLTHRVIKINGRYCVTAGFFKNAYRFGQLKDTLVYSETCEFLGVDDSIDLSMANALLAGGASAVVGYVNNVYTVYSRSMLWDTVNYLILGQSIGQAEHTRRRPMAQTTSSGTPRRAASAPMRRRPTPCCWAMPMRLCPSSKSLPTRRPCSRPRKRCTLRRFIVYWGMAEICHPLFQTSQSCLRSAGAD